MTTTALPYTSKILLSSQKSKNYNDISAQFGDGYQQVAANGLNSVRDVWTINWANLSLTEITNLESILDLNGSWGIYSWTPCYENTSKNFRLVKDSYTRNAYTGAIFGASIKLIQVFDLGS